MPLQNRVDPWGEIRAVPERGTMLGNRGGRFHRDDRSLGKRRWASHHWICCELHYRDMHHEAMGKGYTSLFFLDEVTALAAGHRPCFFCRRKEANAFRAAGAAVMSDPQLEGEAFAVRGELLLRWSFAGYAQGRPRLAGMRGKLLTPPSILRILHQGYRPRWHPSALAGGDR